MDPAPPDPEAPPTTGSHRKRLLTALRAIGTLALVTWIVLAMEWDLVWRAVRTASPMPLVAVLVLLALGPILSAYKWQLLLAVHGLRYPLGRLSRWYVASIFLSQFLPTTIGGDAYRIYQTIQGHRARSRAVLAVLVERASGMAALAAMGYVSALVVHHRTESLLAGVVVVIGGAGGIVGVLGTWLLFRLPAAALLARWPLAARFSTWLVTVTNEFRAHPREIGRAVVLSFLFHLDRIAVIWLTLTALGQPPALLELTVATTLVEIAAFLPISLGGLGVTEGSFIYAMGQFGMQPETALAAMLLIRVLLVPLHVLGATFYFAEGNRHRPAGPLAASAGPDRAAASRPEPAGVRSAESPRQQ